MPTPMSALDRQTILDSVKGFRLQVVWTASLRLVVLGGHQLCAWWAEVLALLAPIMLLPVFALGPGIPAVLRSEASLGTIVTVQGTVTGLSLIALVLAVELARRQEDRDDTVYEIMLRSAWIRPTFVFALAALLATLAALVLVDFSAIAAESHSTNLLLFSSLLTGAVTVAMLVTVLRTIHVLRPSGVIEYRFRANDRERQHNLKVFLARALDEFANLDPLEQLFVPHRPLGLTATERLFAEVDDALQSGHSARFSGALQRLRQLIANSADDIASSPVGFQPPGTPPLGYWFPLDALGGRLEELWRAAFARQGHEFAREMWSLQYWLIQQGIQRKSGELLEVGLRSGMTGYQVAKESGRSRGHARHEWINLKGPAWWRLTGTDGRDLDASSELFIRRLVEYLQEYGHMVLREDDQDSFRDLLVEFRQAYYDAARHQWFYHLHSVDENAPLSIFEYAVMALLALAGHAITLKERSMLSELEPYLEPILEMVESVAAIERYVPAAYDHETPIHNQWSWWELIGEDRDDFVRIEPERYIMSPLLVSLLRNGSSGPLPSLKGFAQRVFDAWEAHKDEILAIGGVTPAQRDEVIGKFRTLLQTSRTAEERERDDFHMASPLDQSRVEDFLTRMRADREDDRVFQFYFEQAGRVQQLTEAEWGDEARLAHGWLLPRGSFVDDVSYLPIESKELVREFELALAVQLSELVLASSRVHSVVEMVVDEVLSAVEAAMLSLGEGRRLIVLAGAWPNNVTGSFRMRMYTDPASGLSPRNGRSSFVLGAFKGQDVLLMHHQGEPVVLVLAPGRWGWLTRAPKEGNDVLVQLKEINSKEAVRIAGEELAEEVDEEERAARIRGLRLLVRVHAEERAKFEVEDADGARVIQIVSVDYCDDVVH